MEADFDARDFAAELETGAVDFSLVFVETDLVEADLVDADLADTAFEDAFVPDVLAAAVFVDVDFPDVDFVAAVVFVDAVFADADLAVWAEVADVFLEAAFLSLADSAARKATGTATARSATLRKARKESV